MTQPVLTNVWTRSDEEFEELRATAFQRFTEHVDLPVLNSLKAVAIGCGSVGSWSIISAAKTGIVNWLVVDFDKVEMPNTANQIWGPSHIGKSKCVLMSGMLKTSGFVKSVQYQDRKFRPEDLENRDVVLCCVDNMEARKEIFEESIKAGCRFFFDARTGSGIVKVYIFDPQNPESARKYRKTVDTTAKTVELRCTDVGGVVAPLLAAACVSTALASFSNGKFKDGFLYSRGNLDIICNSFGETKMVPASTRTEQVEVKPKQEEELPDILKRLTTKEP